MGLRVGERCWKLQPKCNIGNFHSMLVDVDEGLAVISRCSGVGRDFDAFWVEVEGTGVGTPWT
jgi:hypothetical protein